MNVHLQNEDQTMSEIEFLSWVRGTGFQIATIIFVAGVVIRFAEILLLGRKPDLAEAKGSEMQSGLRTIISRSVPDKSTFKRSTFTIVAGYIFHIGLFVTIFLFAPHILMFKEVVGFSWPALPTPIVDAMAVVTIIALLAVLAHRMRDTVLKFLSTKEDYFVWLLTTLPLITGYIAFHRIGTTAPTLLAIHILSVELLLVAFPFTKLMHSFTFALSRWYNGAISGYRGVQS
jgi:nitrate reductase gamma subunit